jgi:hypothetical protein
MTRVGSQRHKKNRNLYCYCGTALFNKNLKEGEDLLAQYLPSVTSRVFT